MKLDPKVIELIKTYDRLVEELKITYYLQNGEEIALLGAEVERLEKEVGITWVGGKPVHDPAY